MSFLAMAALMAMQTSGIVNGDFHNGTTAWMQATYGAQPTVTVENNALKIQSQEPSDTAVAQDVQLRAGTLYRLSALIKTQNLDPKGALVSGSIQAQAPGGATVLGSSPNLKGDTDWTQESVTFVAPPGGLTHLALFFCGWGRGTGTAWFKDVQLHAVDAKQTTMKVLNEPLCPGRISPFQYGQFIEYLCDLVPGMWAEKLYDGSFEGLSPYKFVFVKETDFKEKPWYPYGERNRVKVESDTTTSISGPASKKIELTAGPPCEGGVAQDGISVNKGIGCRFSIYSRGTAQGEFKVRLFHGQSELASATLPVGTDWGKASTELMPKETTENATLSIVFEGPGTYWLDSASLMPNDSVGGWRKDVFEALKALKSGIIRMGGSVLDDPNLGTFEWTDTIGDPDRRKPFQAWGGLQETGPGLEELVQLMQVVGAEPLLCIRYEKKTPKEAADEVEYFNGSIDTPMGALRAKNGHSKPYGIKYWQIGNERWGDAYWEAVPKFARAIKAADPSIKVLSSFPSEQLIKGAARELDYVSPHQYEVENLAVEKQELDDTRRLITQFGGGKPIKAAVTEWNTTAGDAGLMRAKLWTLSNALACSRYQNLLHREADLVEIANRSNLTNSFCSGIIQTSRSSMYLTPTYYAQQLYATLGGTRPVKIESEIPADILVDTSATLSEDGQWLTLFAINDQFTPITRKMDLSAFGHRGQKLEVVTLEDTRKQGHPDATNGFDDPQRVYPAKSTFQADSPSFEYTFPPLSLTVLRWRVTN